MSNDKPSIAELQRETDRWPTRWQPARGEEGEWIGVWWCENSDGDKDRISADTDEDYANDFAAYVASLANATPVLLEIAMAALAWRAQRVQNLLDAVMRTEAEIEAEDPQTRLARVKRTADLSRALEAVLAKVRL